MFLASVVVPIGRVRCRVGGSYGTCSVIELFCITLVVEVAAAVVVAVGLFFQCSGRGCW